VPGGVTGEKTPRRFCRAPRWFPAQALSILRVSLQIWFRSGCCSNARGGIWADVDMVCLQPFDYAKAPGFFAWQDDSGINNAVPGCRQRSTCKVAEPPLASTRTGCLPYDDMHTRLRQKSWRPASGKRS